MCSPPQIVVASYNTDVHLLMHHKADVTRGGAREGSWDQITIIAQHEQMKILNAFQKPRSAETSLQLSCEVPQRE